MPTGFSRGGVDFDDVFDPYVEGAKSGSTSMTVGGTDLNQRYAHISYGSKAADVGHSVGGVDVSNFWAAKGTASYTQAIVIGFGQYRAESADSHDAGAGITLEIKADGTFTVSMYALHSPSGMLGAPLSGNWHAAPGAGAGNQYEVRFTPSVTSETTQPAVNGTFDSGTGWLALSANRQITAKTGHYIAGGAEAGSGSVSGSYLIEIRKVGAAQVKSSTMHFEVYADAG